MKDSSLPSKIFLGQRGENLAVQYLLSRDYKIIARNHRFGHREIDIIAQRDGFFYFCEVKTRQQKINKHFLFNPVTTDSLISRQQIINLKRAALDYSTQNHVCLEKCFFDLIVVFISIDNFCAELKHYREIF